VWSNCRIIINLNQVIFRAIWSSGRFSSRPTVCSLLRREAWTFRRSVQSLRLSNKTLLHETLTRRAGSLEWTFLLWTAVLAVVYRARASTPQSRDRQPTVCHIFLLRFGQKQSSSLKVHRDLVDHQFWSDVQIRWLSLTDVHTARTTCAFVWCVLWCLLCVQFRRSHLLTPEYQLNSLNFQSAQAAHFHCQTADPPPSATASDSQCIYRAFAGRDCLVSARSTRRYVYRERGGLYARYYRRGGAPSEHIQLEYRNLGWSARNALVARSWSNDCTPGSYSGRACLDLAAHSSLRNTCRRRLYAKLCRLGPFGRGRPPRSASNRLSPSLHSAWIVFRPGSIANSARCLLPRKVWRVDWSKIVRNQGFPWPRKAVQTMATHY